MIGPDQLSEGGFANSTAAKIGMSKGGLLRFAGKAISAAPLVALQTLMSDATYTPRIHTTSNRPVRMFLGVLGSQLEAMSKEGDVEGKQNILPSTSGNSDTSFTRRSSCQQLLLLR